MKGPSGAAEHDTDKRLLVIPPATMPVKIDLRPGSPVGISNPVTISIHSIAFRGSDREAPIPLRLPDTMEFLGNEPEWVTGDRSQPVAYLAGSRPILQVTFARAGREERATGVWVIGAEGEDRRGVAPREVSLTFDHHGRSGPHEFVVDGPLPATIGTIALAWRWHARRQDMAHELGRTRHVCHVLRQQPVPPARWAVKRELATGPRGASDVVWAYLPLVEWTCAWARGLTDDKGICDAVLEQLPSSGLRYAEAAWDVRGMLRAGGGYCGGWYRMFQAMVGTQGVTVERRCYKVDWRVEPGEQARWCAIAVDAPGINRTEPAEHPSAFHDEDASLAEQSPVQTCHTRRYRFWGLPHALHDGHSINFLHHEGRWYLYDACFFRVAVALDGFHLPAADPARRVPVDTLGAFKAAYLDRAVHHMLGSLEHGGHRYRTLVPDTDDPEFHGAVTRNGLTVKTALLPARDRAITFFWTH